jgi:hypothetical protein
MNLRFYFTQKVSLINLLNKNPNEKVLKMYKITSRFQQQESFRSHGHSGIDFFMEEGTTLRTIRDGVVERIVNFGDKVNAGKCVMIRWGDGKVAIYGHLSKFKNGLHVGDKVQKGDIIGFSGHSGHVVGKTGNHLHFGLKENGHFIDPSSYINDIQHMNDQSFLANLSDNVTEITHPTEVTQVKLNFFDYMNQHMNVLSDLKMHLIHLPYDTLLIQISKQLLQFISVHASFLQSIITHII